MQEQNLLIETSRMTLSQRVEWLIVIRRFAPETTMDEAPLYRAECEDAYGYGRSVERAEAGCMRCWSLMQEARAKDLDPYKSEHLIFSALDDLKQRGDQDADAENGT